MKKLIVLMLALLCCAGLLGGCVAVEYKPDSGFDVRAGTDDLKKTQQIKITDAATGKVLAVFDGEREIEQFLGQLDEDSWKIRDLAETPPEAAGVRHHHDADRDRQGRYGPGGRKADTALHHVHLQRQQLPDHGVPLRVLHLHPGGDCGGIPPQLCGAISIGPDKA